MRRIAHISDLHFGTENPNSAESLVVELASIAPDLLVVSGDLTQRAKEAEFRAARAYLDCLKMPQLIVPGNHDIPFYRVIERFIFPLTRYRRWITDDLTPFYLDDELAVAGINTARSNTWKEGRVSERQIVELAERFRGVPEGRFKILVAHHPFIPPEYHPQAAVVGGVERTISMLEAHDCGLILSGHLHRASSGDVRAHHMRISRSIIAVQAGTSLSNRTRGEANTFNLLTLMGDRLELDVRSWNGRSFSSSGQKMFRQGLNGWESELPMADGPMSSPNPAATESPDIS